MKDIFEQLDHIKFDHSRWLNELVFSLKEIELYQNRLVEMIEEDEGKREELSAMFGEFEQQKKLAKDIKLTIKKHVVNISQLAHSNGELKAMINSGHKQIREEMETFRILYAALKENFHRFSALQD